MKIQINEEDAKRHMQLNPDRGITMDTIELIKEAYTRIADGMKRIDLENDKGVTVKAYRAGTIIRIDIKEGE